MKHAEIEDVLKSVDDEETSRRDKTVQEEFWPKFRAFAARLPFAEDVAAAWFCATDSQTPLRVRGTLLAALAYFIMPLDMIPDILAFVGMTDDIAVLTLAFTTISSHITEEHRAKARAALSDAAGPEAENPIS